VQRGAEALYSEEGREQVRALIDHYMGNARILSEGARAAGFAVHGGTNAPYIWVETRPGQTSWQTFDWMLRKLNVVITPGSGFGSRGKASFAFRRLIAVPMPWKSRGGCAMQAVQAPDPEEQLSPFHFNSLLGETRPSSIPKGPSLVRGTCAGQILCFPLLGWLRKIYRNCIVFVS
jgi:Aspartate/tyrosine/aromatic aminotransferase